MNMITKEELEKLILVDNLPYTKIAEIYSVSDVTIRTGAVKLGINIPVRKKSVEIKICPNCGKDFPQKKNGKGGFTETCSPECGHELKSKRHYEKYLLDNSIAYGQRNMINYKKGFLLEQNNKCAICKINNIGNNQELVFVLDHIDGNADNNERINLRLVCPNCDSQLETFKSKNKNSARAKYRKT